MKSFLIIAMLLLSQVSFAYQAIPIGTLNQAPASIIISTTTSSAVATQGCALVGIQLPAAFTGTTITFQVATSLAGTYQTLKSTTSGSSLSYTVAQGTYVAIDPKDFQGVQFIKVVSGSSEAAARSLTLMLKGF